MSRGILGVFETCKAGIAYPCMTGDIANTAELREIADDTTASLRSNRDALPEPVE
jgi:hypothetical protein